MGDRSEKLVRLYTVWDGDVAIIGQVKNKLDSKSQCQIVVDVLHDKAPATLLKRCDSISRLVNGLHGDVRVFLAVKRTCMITFADRGMMPC